MSKPNYSLYNPDEWQIQAPSVNPYFGAAAPKKSSFSVMNGESTSGFNAGKMADGFMEENTFNLGVGDVGKAGSWMEPAKFGLQALSVGVDVFNAYEQSKMNDFMRDYYADMMDLQKADFANAARSTNEELFARQQRRESARGVTTGTAENDAAVASYMDKWGVQETV